MSKISPASSVRRKRIHASFVHRTRTLRNGTSSVDPVDPVRPVLNNISYSSANHLMSSDAFYDKLELLEREYLNFYHQERNLQKAVDDIEENENLDMVYMKNLMDKYNKTAVALRNFDREINTNHSENIQKILEEYREDLNTMGIYILEENKLKLDEEIFKENLLESKDNLQESFKPIKEMILKLYKSFRNIKGPSRDDLDSKYDEFPNRDYSGIIMDEKS